MLPMAVDGMDVVAVAIVPAVQVIAGMELMPSPPPIGLVGLIWYRMSEVVVAR